MSTEVQRTPVKATLLDEELVLARLGDHVAAFQDLCIHRGTPLSIGRIEAESLVCAYHGWTFDHRGACVRIPQWEEDHPIPGKARVASYRVAERFGVLWVCLGEPQVAFPEYPEYDDPSYRTVFVGAQDWNAGAARMMENFIDTGHLAWVHPGVLGDERRPRVDVSPVRAIPDGMAFSAANDVVGEDGAWQTEPVDYTFTLPYFFRVTRERVRVVSDVERDPLLEPRYVLIIAIQPIGPALSRRYTWVSRNYAKDPALDDRFTQFLLKLAEQDRRIVELQRPERLPLDITAEMHIRDVDAPAIAFRRLLAERGLDESALPKSSRLATGATARGV